MKKLTQITITDYNQSFLRTCVSPDLISTFNIIHRKLEFFCGIFLENVLWHEKKFEKKSHGTDLLYVQRRLFCHA